MPSRRSLEGPAPRQVVFSDRVLRRRGAGRNRRPRLAGRGGDVYSKHTIANRFAPTAAWIRRGVTVPVVLLLAGVLAGCFLLPREEQVLAPPLMQTPEVTYQTVQAERADIENAVVVSGSFIYPDLHTVYFEHRSGPLRNVYIGLGQDVQAGEVLAELDTNALVLNIAQQEIALRKAQLQLDRTRALRSDSFSIQIAQLDVEAAGLRLQQLQDELGKSRVVAPISGEVVYVARLEEGGFVSTYTTVAQIADPKVRLLAYNGFNRGDFRPGMAVGVTIRGETFEGEVLWTPLNAPRDVSEEMRELVLIKVFELPDTVQRGDAATVRLVLERKQNVIVVPRNLVQTYLGRRFVYVLEDGLRQERNVGVGIQTSTRTEITEGLEEGEILVVR